MAGTPYGFGPATTTASASTSSIARANGQGDPALVTRSVGLYALVGEDQADLERRFRRLQERGLAGLLDGVSLDQWRRGDSSAPSTRSAPTSALGEALGVDSLIVSVAATPFSVVSADDVDLVARACSL